MIAYGLAVIVVYLLIIELTVGRSRRSLQREKGTLPAPWYTGFRDHFLGLDLFKKNLRLLREHRLLEASVDRFQHDKVSTFRIVFLGMQAHITTEAENLKVIQAIDFKKWGLPQRRKYGFRPLLGEGTFTCTRQRSGATRLKR